MTPAEHITAEMPKLTAYELQVLIGTTISGRSMSPDLTFDLPAAWARLKDLGLIDRADGIANATPAGVELVASLLTELQHRRAEAAGTPEGWVLAPRKATDAMLQAAADQLFGGGAEGSTMWDAMLAASPSSPASGVRVKALADVAAERQRQMDVEGWTPEHDDAHSKGELAQAAGVYALAAGSHDYRWVLQGLPVNDYLAASMKLWPWHKSWWKPKDRRRDLVRAGALIVAEIERLDRLSALGEQP